MAKETIKLLFDSIKKKTRVQQLIFEGELVPGESVKKEKVNEKIPESLFEKETSGIFFAVLLEDGNHTCIFRKPFSRAVDKVCQMK